MIHGGLVEVRGRVVAELWPCTREWVQAPWHAPLRVAEFWETTAPLSPFVAYPMKRKPALAICSLLYINLRESAAHKPDAPARDPHSGDTASKPDAPVRDPIVRIPRWRGGLVAESRTLI